MSRHEYYYDSGGGVGPARQILTEQHAAAALEELDASVGEMEEASRADLDSANACARAYARAFR